MEILTDRLRLREFIPEDVDIVAEYRTDPAYLEHYSRGAYTRQECEAFVKRCIGRSVEIPRLKFQLAITSRQEDTLLGNCGIRRNRAGAPRGEIGYELSPAHWGQGYATEATSAILRLGFEELNLNEIEARCVVSNERSARLLRRLAFREVDRLPPGPGRGAFNEILMPERYLFLLSRSDWRTREP